MIWIGNEFPEGIDEQGENSPQDVTEGNCSWKPFHVVVHVEEVGQHHHPSQPYRADDGEEDQQCHHYYLILIADEGHRKDVEAKKAGSHMVESSFVLL